MDWLGSVVKVVAKSADFRFKIFDFRCARKYARNFLVKTQHIDFSTGSQLKVVEFSSNLATYWVMGQRGLKEKNTKSASMAMCYVYVVRGFYQFEF